MSKSPLPQQVITEPFSYPGWPTAPSLPNQPRVRAVFMGLIAFSYNRNRTRAELVFNDGDNRHQLEITVIENNQIVDRFTNARSISLGIEGEQARVYFLREGGTQDFGYLVDLNDARFYPHNTPQKPFGVKMTVTQGTFYTEKLTKYRLSKVTVPAGNIPLGWWNEDRIGQLAEHVAVAFDLAGNQLVSLTVNGQTTGFPTQPGRQTLITFDNVCKENGAPCRHRRGNLFESLRNDFHFHRDILDLPLSPFRYGLELATGELTSKGLDPVTGLKPQSNDEAPCTGGGYGGADGLPPFE